MRISHSSKENYLGCAYQWYLHYMRKLRPTEEKSSFAFGAAVDVGLNTLLETRSLNEALIKFQEYWTMFRDNQNIKYTKSDLEEHLIEDVEPRNEKDKSWLSLYEKGNILITEYNEQIMPRIKRVIKVQLDQTIKNHTNDELVIKTDFICEWEDGRILLVDNKTSSVKYEADSVKNSAQLATYFDPLKEEYKLDACAYIVLPKKINKKKKPAIDIKVIIDTVSEDTVEKTFNEYETVLNGIKEAKFEKNTQNCTNKFGKCTYFNYCNNKDSTGLVEKSDK